MRKSSGWSSAFERIRLPFITAEVIGDELPPTIGSILNDASGSLIDCSDARTIAGYAAHGRSVGAAVQPLVETLAVQLFDDGQRLRTPSPVVVVVDAEHDFGANTGEAAPRYEREQTAASQLPTAIRLSYYDPALDYQFGEARASVSDGNRLVRQHDLPAVIDADSAKALAQQQLARAWAEQDRLTLRLPARHLAVEPGACVELPFNPGRWIVERVALEGFVCVLGLGPAWEAAPILTADAGRILQRSAEVGEMSVALFEAPATADEEGDATLLLAASSTATAWRTTTVEIEVGSHKLAELTARRKSVLGRTLAELAPGKKRVTVELIDPDQWLTSCDEEALTEGANLAMIGGEMIQFRDAEPIGAGKFRLDGLVRAVGGKEGSSDCHASGAFFLLLERDTLRRIALPKWFPSAGEVTARLSGPGPGHRVTLKRKEGARHPISKP